MSKLPRKLPDGVHEAFTTLAQLYATVESELLTAMNLFEQHGNMRSDTAIAIWKREVSQWLRRMRNLGNQYGFVANRPRIVVSVPMKKEIARSAKKVYERVVGSRSGSKRKPRR